MPTLSPYLFFDGTCREAMTAYADILGGEVLAMMTYGDAPPQEGMEAVPAGLVMHAAVKIGDQLLMASDDMPGRYVRPAATHVSVSFAYPAAAQEAFDRLADGGEITMPFGPTFWSPGFGTLRDRWGTPWMVGADTPAQ